MENRQVIFLIFSSGEARLQVLSKVEGFQNCSL